MDMYEAVTSRRAVSGFTDRHVPREVLERVLSAAAWASSAPDLQPRRVYVLTGRPLAELEKLVGERDAVGDSWSDPACEQYSAAPKPPYGERRPALGAPAVLFCYVDRDLGPEQWSDVGMYLQTVMLLLRAEGLHSCTQMAWAKYHRAVAEVLAPPDELILFCGMSIGFEGAAETAATCSTSTPRDQGTGTVDPAGRHPRRARWMPRVAARLHDLLTRRMRQMVSQIGLPP
ncbi:nitroreductase family protein [Streptomyces sp. NPDC057199]|uniref:nitroreductase family protein n=1 Tax=Streptomyces sp. NPDC057199 TaxID=3346047 RepID=UPI00362BF97B